MGRKTLTVVTVVLALSLSVAIPRWRVIGAGGDATESDASLVPQRTEANSFGSALGAPFRAIGRLFGGGKKKKPVSKISDKDIKKFEVGEASRKTDATTPNVAPAAQDATAAEHLAKGREFLGAGQLNEAISELTTATSLDPKSGEAFTLLGVAYDRKGIGGRAQEAFEAAARTKDNEALHLNNLGFFHYRHGNYEEAVKYLKRATKLDAKDTRIWSNLATAQLAVDKYDDAFKSLVKAVGDFDGHVKIAAHLERVGREKDAIKHLELARALQPTSTDVLASLVTLYGKTGDNEKADTARQALVSLRTVAAAPSPK